MSIDANLNRIRAYRRQYNLARYRFACLAGVNEAAIRNIDTTDWNPTANTIRKFEQVIPPEFMANANDDTETSSEPQATPVDRGEDQTEAA
ncbi:helix-turn-helix domain-containing protein [Thalassospira sp. UBA1131]|uniref:helix-turn-helix domain-containing protein n=1 Tax=Thalassospira sp. UBA1131 TaxID=1947672 RepID=UPI0025CB9B5D|nr:helix-turn-helix transcriptional regulator [Thalassospira sp. UBA1131]